MYDVILVSKYIIKQFNLKYNGINYLKLNCLLFFVQQAFINANGIPCFKEEIIATSCGVKVDAVTKQYQWNGISPILYDINLNAIEIDDSLFKKEDKELIDSIIDNYSSSIAGDLANLIKKQTVWNKVYYNLIREDRIITIDDIKKYCIDKESEYKRKRKMFVLIK